jgi:hypothetical protein
VRWLRRWLQRDGAAALQDFYLRAGLGQAPGTLPYAIEDLLEGLDKLAEDASPALRQFAAKGLPPGWRAFIGAKDPLLDAAVVCQSLPGCEIVAGAGHRPAELLQAAGGKTPAPAYPNNSHAV